MPSQPEVPPPTRPPNLNQLTERSVEGQDTLVMPTSISKFLVAAGKPLYQSLQMSKVPYVLGSYVEFLNPGRRNGRERALAEELVYLEGHGDLVSALITPISHIITPVIPIFNLLTKSHDPPSMYSLRGAYRCSSFL